jgi:ribosomal-protein-alanine N-acetyltransferase
MRKLNFTPFPALQTERLILRELNINDAAEIFLLRSDDRVNQYISREKARSIDEVKTFIQKIIDGIKQNKNLYWAICAKNNPKIIGTICLWNFSDDLTTAEVGYELSPQYQGKGIMNEALQCLLQYSFNTLELTFLEAFTHRDNDKSNRLLDKNGFKQLDNRTDEENIYNRIYVLSKNDWKG